MKPRPFAYHRPRALDEALALLAEGGDDAAVLAGGQSLVPMMNVRLAAPERLVDINGLEELGGIALEDGRLRIGALVRHQEIAEHALVRERLPLLARIAASIAHLPIRTRGTIGGSLAHADPAAQWPLAAVLLEAEITLASTRGTRNVAARDFFEGALATARGADEILTTIRLPLPPPGHRSGFRLLARRPGDYAVAMAAAVAVPGAQGGIASLRLAIGGVEPLPLDRSPPPGKLPAAAPDAAWIAEVAAGAWRDVAPMDDPRAPADYRRRVLPTLVSGCVAEALLGAGS